MARFDKKSRQKVLSGSLFGSGVLLAIVLFAITNYFGWKYHQRFDWTESQLYSLSENTENVLAELDRYVEVVVVMSPGGPLTMAGSTPGPHRASFPLHRQESHGCRGGRPGRDDDGDQQDRSLPR